MAKTIMLQGTSSHVGKSVLAAALCRIFRQDGYTVVPFKAQNMALNSYITREGGEMGRAQVTQAEAAGVEPEVCMNPVLLKPTGQAVSQIIVLGQVVGTMEAGRYHGVYSQTLRGVVEDSLRKLQAAYDVVVVEGAGSPAEINLKKRDIANMFVAKMAPAPVLLVVDIDRGGSLASIVGTLELLEPQERELVKGILINKFRGDRRLLEPALDFIEEYTGKPVVGVIPHISDLGIEEEDSVGLTEHRGKEDAAIDIAVIQLPHISNYTDFDALEAEPDVCLRYVRRGQRVGKPDLLILPGSKSTVADLQYLREQDYDFTLRALAGAGIPIIGICGGYQMLGREIRDPYGVESKEECVPGLGLLAMTTTFAEQKQTHQVVADCCFDFLGQKLAVQGLCGYEIHMGGSEQLSVGVSPFTIRQRSGETVNQPDGLVSLNGQIMGTYIHGLFDHDEYRRALINLLRCRKNLPPLPRQSRRQQNKDHNYDRLAAQVRANLNMPLLYQILEEPCP